MVVYKITNLLNGKIYIGATTKSSYERFNYHLKEMRAELNGKRPSTIFHRALAEYGERNFVIEDLEYCSDEKTLFEREDYWIRKLNAINLEIGYNNAYGGKSGLKQQGTKDKLREKKLENWKNKDFREKALYGLRKGTETVKGKAKCNFVPIICQNCGKTFYGKPYEAKTRKYCSTSCAGQINGLVANKIASKLKSENTKVIHEEMKKYIINWCTYNSKLVLNCPFNKISTIFEPLRKEIENKFGIKDFRIICQAIIGNYSKKLFLEEVQSIVKMYAEQ